MREIFLIMTTGLNFSKYPRTYNDIFVMNSQGKDKVCKRAKSPTRPQLIPVAVS